MVNVVERRKTWTLTKDSNKKCNKLINKKRTEGLEIMVCIVGNEHQLQSKEGISKPCRECKLNDHR